MSTGYLLFLSVLAAHTLIILMVIVVGLRLLGKRQIGQMNVYDLVLIMALSNCVQNAMTHGNGNLSAGIVTSGTLMFIGWASAKMFVLAPGVEKHIVGSPTVLVNQGEVLPDRMRREHITNNELMAALRRHGLQDAEDAAVVVLEIDGTLSVVPKGAKQSRTKDRVEPGAASSGPV